MYVTFSETQRGEAANSKSEITNKSEVPTFETRLLFIWNIRILDLFRISDFLRRLLRGSEEEFNGSRLCSPPSTCIRPIASTRSKCPSYAVLTWRSLPASF